MAQRHRDGTLVHIKLTTSPIFDESGNVAGVGAVGKDISEIVRMQAALEESERKYQVIRDNVSDILGLANPDGIITQVAPSCERIIGFSPEFIKGKSIYHLLSDGDKDRAQARIRTAQPFSAEFWCPTAFGGSLYMEMRGTPVVQGGRVTHIVMAARDITQRKRDTDTIERLHYQLDTILNSVADGICEVSHDESITFCNPACLSLLGYTADEFIGHPPSATFLPGADDQTVPCGATSSASSTSAIRLTLRDGVKRHVTCARFVRKDGSKLAVDYTCAPVICRGRVTGVVVSFRDLTHRLEMESAVRKADKLRLAGQLAAGVAHEILNPLTSVRGFLQMMESGSLNPYYIEVMSQEMECIETIIKEFLWLAKPQVRSHQHASVVDVVADVIDLVSTQATLHDVTVKFETPMAVPNIHCEVNSLKQVFANIMNNAIQAMEDGGVMKVSIASGTDTNTVVVRIEDTGIGIPKDVMPKLGEPFYSLKNRGTGLGLMVCYKIVEEHGGSIEVESVEGEGTVVTVCLPVAAVGVKPTGGEG